MAFQLSAWLAYTNLPPYSHGESKVVLPVPTVRISGAEEKVNAALGWGPQKQTLRWRFRCEWLIKPVLPGDPGKGMREAGREGGPQSGPGKGASSLPCRAVLQWGFHSRARKAGCQCFPHSSGISQGPLGGGREVIHSRGQSAPEGTAAPVAWGPSFRRELKPPEVGRAWRNARRPSKRMSEVPTVSTRGSHMAQPSEP